jgi:hypothetical protein
VPKVTTEICILVSKMSHLRRVNQNDLTAVYTRDDEKMKFQ